GGGSRALPGWAMPNHADGVEPAPSRRLIGSTGLLPRIARASACCSTSGGTSTSWPTLPVHNTRRDRVPVLVVFRMFDQPQRERVFLALWATTALPDRQSSVEHGAAELPVAQTSQH